MYLAMSQLRKEGKEGGKQEVGVELLAGSWREMVAQDDLCGVRMEARRRGVRRRERLEGVLWGNGKRDMDEMANCGAMEEVQ